MAVKKQDAIISLELVQKKNGGGELHEQTDRG